MDPLRRGGYALNPIVREYRENDSLGEITDLLHRAYADLAARGMKFVASHQGVSTTRERIQSGKCFVAELEGRIVGTITVYTGGSGSKCDLYNQPGVARFGQFAVDPDLQGHGIGRTLIEACESYAMKDGCDQMALDTARAAGDLIRLYEKLGYKIVSNVDWDVTNYVSVVMSKRLKTAARS